MEEKESRRKWRRNEPEPSRRCRGETNPNPVAGVPAVALCATAARPLSSFLSLGS